jgi:hypothetical protein
MRRGGGGGGGGGGGEGKRRSRGRRRTDSLDETRTHQIFICNGDFSIDCVRVD